MSAVTEPVLNRHGQGGRHVIESGERTRVATPMAYIEACATQTEQDFLWRYYEAWDFANGNAKVVDEGGEPLGRYADHAARIDPKSYIRFEIQAYRWVRDYGLGKEWGVVAEMFVRMMAGRAQIEVIDWGSYLTNSDDEKICIGGAQVSMRFLGLRLKDGYRDFFRWYRYIQQQERDGQPITADGALLAMQREKTMTAVIDRFKQEHSLEIKG